MNVSKLKRRAGRTLLWTFFFSLVLHFTLLPLLLRLFGEQLAQAQRQQQPVETITLSSAVRFEKRPIPRTARHITPPAPQPAARSSVVTAAAAPPPRELARITPRARVSIPQINVPHARAPSLAAQLAEQQQMYTRTIEKLRRQNDPVIGAAQPNATPAAIKRYNYDFSGSIGSPLGAEGILYPQTMWKDGPWDYYYVKYWVQYPDGTSETGSVPWPIRFPADADPLKMNHQHLPLAGPLPGYVLPADAYLRPLVAFCYEHHFASCPIEHE